MENERILTVDTSNRWSCLGLWRDGSPVGEMNLDLGRRQAGTLPLAAQALLETAGCSFDDLTALGVAVGPGYFTGIRIGMAYVSGLALALSLPVVPLSSLEILAGSFPAAGVTVPLIAASRSQAFSSAWSEGVEVLPEAERSREELEARLAAFSTPVHMVALDDPRLFSQSCRDDIRFLCSGSGASAARLAAQKLEKAVDPAELEARYLREPGLGTSAELL